MWLKINGNAVTVPVGMTSTTNIGSSWTTLGSVTLDALGEDIVLIAIVGGTNSQSEDGDNSTIYARLYRGTTTNIIATGQSSMTSNSTMNGGTQVPLVSLDTDAATGNNTYYLQAYYSGDGVGNDFSSMIALGCKR